MPLRLDVPHHHYNRLLIRIALTKGVVIVDYIIVTAWFLLSGRVVAFNLIDDPQQVVLLVDFVRAPQVLQPRLRHPAQRCHKTPTAIITSRLILTLHLIGESERAQRLVSRTRCSH